MRCEACQGTGRVKAPSYPVPPPDRDHSIGLSIAPRFPCPTCGGSGIAHCCEGEREQPWATRLSLGLWFH